MQVIDQTILNFFANNRVEWLSFAMLVITYCGSYVVISGLTILSAISFYIHKHTVRILPLLVAVCGSATTVYILKNIFYRARPLTEAFYLETSSAFPSGHATLAIALYGFFIYILWEHEKHFLKKPLAIFLAVLIVLVGASRLYLGVHYPSDILVGYFIGLVWLWISHLISKLKIWQLLDNERL